MLLSWYAYAGTHATYVLSTLLSQCSTLSITNTKPVPTLAHTQAHAGLIAITFASPLATRSPLASISPPSHCSLFTVQSPCVCSSCCCFLQLYRSRFCACFRDGLDGYGAFGRPCCLPRHARCSPSGEQHNKHAHSVGRHKPHCVYGLAGIRD